MLTRARPTSFLFVMMCAGCTPELAPREDAGEAAGEGEGEAPPDDEQVAASCDDDVRCENNEACFSFGRAESDRCWNRCVTDTCLTNVDTEGVCATLRDLETGDESPFICVTLNGNGGRCGSDMNAICESTIFACVNVNFTDLIRRAYCMIPCDDDALCPDGLTCSEAMESEDGLLRVCADRQEGEECGIDETSAAFCVEGSRCEPTLTNGTCTAT
jgi:hypothetical protein